MVSPTVLYILLVVLLLLLGIVFLYVVIRKARRTAAPAEAALVAAPAGGGDPPPVNLKASNLDLKLSFKKAMRRIPVYGKGARYRIPWYLLIGEAHAGKTTLLGNTGMELQTDAPDEQRTGVKQGLNWFFFNQGIVLDVAGDLVLRADGATSNVKGWNYLTKLLRRYRPDRPLDGVILAIPCSDLTDASSRSPEFKLRLEQKAQSLYNKLVDAQNRLGLTFPVYVLITKCDEVAGFKSLCHEIPARRDEMFGWSSPYTREVAYRAAWVTEAFQNLHRYLFKLQIEVFTERGRVANSDEFFMLPSEIRAMRAPLQIYLDRIFKESAYHDPFFLRGIYFCGDGAGEVPVATVVSSPAEPVIHWQLPQPNSSQAMVVAATATTAAAAAPEKKHAFLGHLFERKIFQEELLARPISRTALSRNRLVLVAQALSLALPLVGILGILATHPTLKERRATFYNYLTAEEQDLKAIQAEKAGGLIEERSRNREARLFEAMTNMSDKRLISPFIPGSWFSNVSEESGNSLSGAYQFVVYDALRLRLDCRTESKLVPLPLSQACYATVATAAAADQGVNKCVFESDYSANSVHTFIESLNELIQHRARYNRLISDNNGDPNELNQLLRYFGHAQLPADFDVHNSLFVQALRTSQRPALRTTDQSVYDRGACKVEGMIQDIYDRTFKNRNVTYGYLGDITKTEALLARKENAWLANRIFEYPSAFQGLTFAAGLGELKRALTDLSKEKFMSRDYGTPLDAPSEPDFHHQARGTLIWDKATLQQAVELYKEYDNFVKTRSYNRLDTLDSNVKRVARNDVARKLAALISRARRRGVPQVMPGESPRRASLRVEIKSFVEAQDLLSNLLDISRNLRIDIGLRSIVTNQLASLINAIDEEFYDGSFYTMAQDGFSWWTSDITFHSYTAFGASNADELEVYLAMQREGIGELARQFAAPVLGFAATQGISLASSVNWKEILGQLDKYDAKKPGNTVAVLENFIRFEMDKVKVGNCASIVAGSSLQPMDYFIRVRNSLRQPFYTRCKTLEEAASARSTLIERTNEWAARRKKEVEFYQGLKSYTDIQDKFNRTLGGKFPFSVLPESEPFSEADPESIIAFFELLAKNKEAATSILEQAPDYNISSREALIFLQQMEAVRVFFDSFLSKKRISPVFDFNLRFRANEGKEIGANQIIDWVFDVGKRRIHYRDVNTAGVWGYGEPLSLSLRWANDSPTVPAFKFDPLSRMKLEGQTVTLTYGNNWSLLYFIIKHRGKSKDFKEGVDIEPHTLKIEVPTEPNPKLANNIQQAQREALRTKSAEVFLRIGLMPQGKKDPADALILPDVFPTHAPRLPYSRPVVQQSQENRSN
jgi:hypothetical protein